MLTSDGLVFKDHDRNGRLDPYEDWRLAPETRVEDLVARMTVREKAGLMMHASPPTSGGGVRARWDLERLRPLVRDRDIRFFIHRVSSDDAGELAELSNAVQEMAEESRLGIPVTLSSDPRSHFQTTFGLSVAAGALTQWPETTGLAATGDTALVERFATMASEEYRAIGVRMALSPMADLASEPRWPRVSGTFGDDPATVSAMVGAYVRGFQGRDPILGRTSVATVVKHWVGYGAQPEGYDAHNPYGRDIVFPARRFQDHMDAFDGAFAAHVSAVMPTYGRPPADLEINGRPAERVGAGYSRQMITELLREGRGFDGIVLTDWKITEDCLQDCVDGTLHYERVGMPWGVESLTRPQRFAKALEAGVDQFGGVADTAVLVQLVDDGVIPEARLDRSVRRLLLLTFRLGLFESPYVDPDQARRVVGSPTHLAEALEAQRRSLVLLESPVGTAPLRDGARVWLWKVSAEEASARGFSVVDDPALADVAVVRMATPFTTRPAYFFGQRHHEGSLEFQDDNPDLVALKRAQAARLVVASVYLDRPAILARVRPLAPVLVGEFGVSDSALLDLLSGRSEPRGRLPFELPSSMQDVERQAPDAPSDTARPLYMRGAGRSGW